MNKIKGYIGRQVASNSALAILAIILLQVLISSCEEKKNEKAYDNEVFQPRYAQGFTIVADDDSVAGVMIKNPWQGADSVAMCYRVEMPAERIVAMSSTFVAMLESLGEVDRIVGVSGLDFISSEAIKARGDEVADVGYNDYFDYEKLVMLNPDVVLLYGVNGPSPLEEKLKELNIPFTYIGEYLEESPLGKAEWVVAIGEIIGKREEAIALFNEIEKRYNAVKESVRLSISRPRVMLNAPYNDNWWLPSTKNYMSQLIADAGGDYIYKENTGNASKIIDIEEAYLLMSEADVWINPGQAASMEQLAEMAPRFTDTRVYCDGFVYNNNRRSTIGGGNDFYESGIMNPDVILKDLVKVFYPSLLEDYEPVYYQQLQ